MATDRSPDRLVGIGVIEDRFSMDTLVAKDDATTPSTYTQQGPRTGVPTTTDATSLLLNGSGSQSEDGHLEIVTLRQGMPGPEGGAFGWRDVAAGDTASELRGWDGPQLITGWDKLLYTNSGTWYQIWPDVVRLSNGKLFAVYGQASSYSLLIATYDPDDSNGTWTATTLPMDGLDYIVDAATLCWLPATERLLMFFTSRDETQVDMAYSDDYGATWTIGGRRVLDTPIAYADVKQLRARWSGGNILLMVAFENASNVLIGSQYASATKGSSFQQIVANWGGEFSPNEKLEFPNLVPLQGGGFLLVYHHADAGAPKYHARKLGSAFEDGTNTELVEIADGAGSGFTAGCTAWQDEDGVIYAFVFTSGVDRNVIPYRTFDGGGTWEAFADTAFFSGTEGDAYLHTFAAETIGGRTALLTRWTADTSTHDSQSVCCMWLGGFSRQTAPAHLQAVNYDDTDYIAFSDDNNGASGLPGWSYVPIELPSSLTNYTVTGGGTESLHTSGRLQIDTTADTLVIEETWSTSESNLNIAADAQAYFGAFNVELDDGDGDDSTLQVAAKVRLSNGEAGHAATYIYEVSIRFDSAGYSVYDEIAGTIVGSAVTYDFTTEGVVRVALDKNGKVRTWHGRPGQVQDFAEGVTGTGLSDDSGTNPNDLSRVQWGHLASTTSTTRWSPQGGCWWAGKFVPETSSLCASSWTNPTDLHPRAYPLQPALVYDGVKVSASKGPAYIDDTYTIEAQYKYPASRLFVDTSPSPEEPWRSKDDSADVEFVFDLDKLFSDTVLESATFGCFLRESNIERFEVDRWDGAAWQNVLLGEASTGFTGLVFSRRGRLLTVDTGTAQKGATYLYKEAHAGDTVELSDDPNIRRRIAHNTEGAWTDEVTKRPMLELESPTGTEPASGTAKIWRRNFGVFTHEHTSSSHIYRFRIPAHDTVDGYFEIGQLLPVVILPFGWVHDRGWQMRRQFNVSMRQRPAGARVSTKRGPTRRTLSLAWTNTSVPRYQTQESEPVPDYITGSDGGEPLAARRDTLFQVLGVLEELDGPNRPLVVIRDMGRGTGNQHLVLDELWMYGRAVTDPQLDHILGKAHNNAVEKLNRLTFEEEL